MVVTINNIGNVDRWQTVFIKNSIGEARLLNNKLSEQLISKKDELRALVGDRYRDLLKTADLIIDMNETMEAVDSEVFKIGAIDDKINWRKHNLVSNKFNDPSTSFDRKLLSLENQSIESFLRSTVNTSQHYVHKINENPLLVAELLTLLEILIDAADQSGLLFPLLKIIREKYRHFRYCVDEYFKKSFICYHSSHAMSLTSVIDQFTAFAIHYKLGLNQSLKEFLRKRLDFISSILANDSNPDEESLIKALFLTSITVSMVSTIYSKGHLQNQLYQRHSTFSLLESPTMASLSTLNITKYKSWMPKFVKASRAVPENCVSNITKERALIKKTTDEMVKDFLNSVVEMLSLSSKNIISRIQSVDTLVSLRQRLLALLDAEEALRELKTADNTSWLAVIFREAWTDRFHFLINKSINGLSKIGEHIEKTYSDIITNSHGQSSITDDSDITQAIAKLKNSKKDLVCLFASLSTYSKGQFGDAKSIIRECEQWETQHQEVMNVVEVFGCLNDFFSKKNSKDVAHHIYDSQNIKEYSSIRSNYEEEDYSQSLDGVKWKRDELSNIKQDYESTVAFISSNTSKTYKAVIANLKKTLENTEYIKFKSCRALTFLSRVLLHFHHSIKEEQSITEELLSLVYRRLGTFLSGFIGDLLSEHIFNLCSGKDPIANSLWVMFSGYEILIPHSPTPSISAIVYQLCQEATDSLGEDQFIWESKSSLFVLNDAISAILASNIVCSLEKQFLFNNKLETNRSSIEENYKATSSDQLSETEGISSVKDSNQALSDTFDENIVETSVESQQVSVENKPDEPDVMINRAVQLYVDIEYLNYVFSTSNFDIALEILKKIIDDTLDNKSANSVYEALSMISSNHFQKTKMLFTPLCSS